MCRLTMFDLVRLRELPPLSLGPKSETASPHLVSRLALHGLIAYEYYTMSSLHKNRFAKLRDRQRNKAELDIDGNNQNEF